MVEENDPLRERWRAKGFLLPTSEASKKREFEFSLFGRVFMGEIRTATTGLWDDYMNSGAVHTSGLSIRKCRLLAEDDHVLEFSQVVFLKWSFSLAIIKGEE